MSKKNNNKKITRNNYRIESLEPRLMMDAAASQWLEEIDSIGLSSYSESVLNDSNFYSRSNWDSQGDVMGLYRQNSTSGELESVSKADFIEEVKNKTRKSFNTASSLKSLKNILKKAVVEARDSIALCAPE